MIVCLAVYNNRLAAVFDSAEQLMLYQIQQDSIRLLGTVPVQQQTPVAIAEQLSGHCVRHLICGAICGCDRRMLAGLGIDITPWICGTTTEVLNALGTNTLHTLAMPGCPQRCRSVDSLANTAPAQHRRRMRTSHSATSLAKDTQGEETT